MLLTDPGLRINSLGRAEDHLCKAIGEVKKSMPSLQSSGFACVANSLVDRITIWIQEIHNEQSDGKEG